MRRRSLPATSSGPRDRGATAVILTSLLIPLSAGADQPWQMHDVWTQGFAEVLHYRGSTGDADDVVEPPMHIVSRVVRLWPDTLTEAEPTGRSARTVEALKVTVTRSTPGLFGRHEQSLAYMTRSDLSPIRSVATIVDASGTTFATWSARQERMRFFCEKSLVGEGEHLLAPTDRLLFFDDLPVRLRGLARVAEGGWEVELVETLVRTGGDPPRVAQAMVTVGGMERVSTTAGTFVARRVSVARHDQRGDRLTDTLYFDRRPPHRLVAWERSDGLVFKLTAVERMNAAAIDSGERAHGDALPGSPATPGASEHATKEVGKGSPGTPGESGPATEEVPRDQPANTGASDPATEEVPRDRPANPGALPEPDGAPESTEAGATGE